MRQKLKENERNLIKRYLIWFYKATKESLDRIDRKFTQVRVDNEVLANLSGWKSRGESEQDAFYQKHLNDFKAYVENKAKEGNQLKFSDFSQRTLKADYQFLKDKLSAVEKAIVVFLGKAELKKIKGLYEDEITRRILEERAHT